MAFIRSKKGLLLYPFFLSLFTTTVVLGVVLQPKSGWIGWALQQWDSWQRLRPQAVSSAKQPAHQELQYQIDAELDTANSLIHGTVIVSIPNIPDDRLLFYLYPATYKPMQIEQVQVNGQSVPYDVTAAQLTVPVKEKTGQARVQIRFTTPIPATGTRLGQKDGVWSLTYWYPILAVRGSGGWIPRPQPLPFGDPYLMDLADYRVRLKHPAGFQWYTSGILVSSVNEKGAAMSEWKADLVRSFALIGGTGWTETAWKTADGVDVKVAVRNRERLDQLREIADTAIKTYSLRFGNFAYPSFSLLEMPAGTVFAHEYPNLALFSEDIWHWGTGEHWIAHEIAHAWWFSSVGTHKALAPWLDEGLADYSALLYTETKHGRDAYEAEIRRDWALFRDDKSYSPHSFAAPVHVDGQKTDQPYANFRNEADYYYLMYLRPQLMYHDLRMAMGEHKFFQFLQQFYLKNRRGTATRERLEEALQAVDPGALPRLKMWLDLPNGELLLQMKERFER
ncbi:M1 family aminopeptidase [Effusibacillus pohliae]|uniref:M1 family aminopeptidase n=1 Tax=Effusibacillus pohliae TaxID=232270 RepID=UPI00035C13C7|nr:M1 family aminopeptidase [Effusibacillus pohliae]